MSIKMLEEWTVENIKNRISYRRMKEDSQEEEKRRLKEEVQAGMKQVLWPTSWSFEFRYDDFFLSSRAKIN